MQQSPLQTLIPPTKLAPVEKALLKTFNTADATDIVSLPGGLSASLVYKITIGERPYLLKLDNSVQAIQTTGDHFACLKLAAQAGIAPPLYYHNLADGLSISAFIEKKPLQSAFPSHDQVLTELGKTIRSMHDMPPFSKENSLSETVETLIEQIKKSPLFTKTLFEDFFEYYDLIKTAYPWQDRDKVPSHNDLNPNNIICDGKKIWIVDWDAAFQNDRYVDLAITANFFVTTAAHEKLFLESYFGNTPDNYKIARFFIMQQVCRLVYAILMFRLVDASNPHPIADEDIPALQTVSLKTVGEKLGSREWSISSWKGQLFYGKALLNEALRNLRSPRFAGSIKTLFEANT